jgi:hypothetical protein
MGAVNMGDISRKKNPGSRTPIPESRCPFIEDFGDFMMKRFVRRLLFTRWHRGFK